jgi:small subunit ribosomal protein S17
MRTKKGTVTSAKMTGTVTVTVHRSVFHPLYQKRYRSSKKFLADSRGIEDIGVGDTVIITECRPLSKNKHFKVTEVLKRVPRVSEMGEEKELVGAMQSKQSSEKNSKKSTTSKNSTSEHSSSSSISSTSSTSSVSQ